MGDCADKENKGVHSPMAAHLLGASWMLLFVGRWVIVQLLQAAGILSATMVSDLDDLVLFRCYLVLLAVTILVVTLRAMRGSKASLPSGLDGSAVGPASLESTNCGPSQAGGGRPNIGD